MRKFDILLVYYLFRKHDYYAHIIKEISKGFKVGLLLSDEEDFYENRRGHKKVQKTDELFRRLCYDMGAEKVLVSEKVSATVVLFPVLPTFTEDFLLKFKTNIISSKIIGLFFFLSSSDGIKKIIDLGCTEFFAPAKFILEMKLKDENKLNEIENLKVTEVGFPHKKYPIFSNEELKIDYLLCFPSHTHFNNSINYEKYRYLVVKSMFEILQKTDPSDFIYIKYHNNRDGQYNFVSKYEIPNQFLWIVKLIVPIIHRLIQLIEFKKIKNFLYKINRNLICGWLQAKYKSLSEVSRYHSFGAESFLPHVRKGLITGNSSTHLHALKNRLPVFNCDERSTDEVTKEYHQVYLVPWDNSSLNFNENYFDSLAKNFVDADLVSLLVDKIKKASSGEQ